MSLFKFAFRNVLRNKKRSFLTMLSIFFAAIIVGLAQGLINGVVNVYVDNFIQYQTGHVKITTAEYKKRERFFPVEELVYGSNDIIRELKKMEEVESVEERIRFGLLLGKDETTTEAVAMGIDLANNKMEISQKRLDKNGKKKDLKKEPFINSGLYIGKGLAKKLKIIEGDKLLIATKTSQGGLNGIKLSVNGIVDVGVGLLNNKSFFMSLADAKKLLKIDDGTTEIFVYAKETAMTPALVSKIKKIIPEEAIAESYIKQMGNFYSTIESSKVAYLIIESIILFLASFVIINTMMMAIFERLQEIGTLKALGMTNREIFINFTLEGAIIGAAGGIPGAIVGYCIIIIIAHYGVNFESMVENMDAPIEYIIRPSISILYLLSAVALSIAIPALAAMIPARYSTKLTPAEALRK
ncbi:MAG: ABC transporter permease [bacterium]|nr:ABC transporter permease [bacterium]